MTTASMHSPLKYLNLGLRKQLSPQLQSEAAECGLACLAMIANYHGHDVDLIALRRRFMVSAHGMSLKQLIDTAAKLDLNSRALKLELQDLEQLNAPCILHWEMKHFVVLKRVTKKGAVIIDPASGERNVTHTELSNSFTGIALELTPTMSFVPQKERAQIGFSQLWSSIIGLKRSLGVILVLSLLLQVFGLISPYYMQLVVDDVILRSDSHLLTVLAIGFGILLIIETSTHLLRQFSVLALASKLNMQMSVNVFRHLLRLPLNYFSKRHMGDIVSRFSSMSQIRELLTNGVVSVLIDGLMGIATFVVMLVYSPKLALVALCAVLLYGLLRFSFFFPIKRLKEEELVSAAKENSLFMESVRGIQSIKLFEKETDRQSRWQNALTDSMNKGIHISQWQFSFETLNRLLFGLENLVIIYLAAQLVMENAMTVGMLYAFISYKSRFVNAMDSLITKWIEFKMLDVHFNRLSDIVLSEQDPVFNRHFHEVENTNNIVAINSLTAKNLTFSYDNNSATTLKGVNLHIRRGESVAIVGASGCGKSTLLKCLMGLYPLSQGQVLANDNDISQLSWYRRSIAAVMQDDQLLSGSILDNIVCFDNQIDMERVVKVAHFACIHHDIMHMTMQYNTLVGDMGDTLSGGQKQRIILARALYRQPDILFMDEATSHLDSDSEAHINQSIKSLAITRIIVAHRPTTINSADRVLKLTDGQLIEINKQKLT
ncbi:peptidase domain-containing ABC transporter [Aestuariibacter sp. AA17]|uniref:Peptidase domain-containing ABC transporter n=1 Tax=Fluctibacter corallii TaxID=2984329 RepID=A0ABT3A7B2_9ALTE|nr:peptidase domain-containing ABC transporter [Aestuariibacter sp. AA17]MCV2884561.1 peptidase domain-containing ABC transporter [Aestuariibacter sp. AA17]